MIQRCKGYHYRLKTTLALCRSFEQYAGACRFVWNKVLAVNEGRYLAGVPRLTYYEAAWLLTQWRHSEEYGWLADVSIHALQHCLRDLERACQNLFAGRTMPPRFRKKFLADSFRFPRDCQLDGNQLKLPKIGWMRFWKSRDIEGAIKNVTIRRDGNRWTVAFQTEREVETPVHPSRSAIGIDLGIATFAAVSDGTLYPPLNAYRRLQAQLAKAQQRAATKVNFSKNWQKCQTAIRRIQATIARCRKDFLHKLSTTISKNHAVIVVEDLQIGNMSRSARGTAEEPGRNVAQKAGLNKAILDQGWGMFLQMLEYKQLWRGGVVLAVNPRYTSQTCPECGCVSKLNRPQQALFSCISCSYTSHADVNAAQNILALGHRERLNAFALRT